MRSVWSLAWLLALPSFVLGCNAILGFDQDYKTGSGTSGGGGSGGTTSTGGSSTGGQSTGGSSTGGTHTGGVQGCKVPEDCPLPPSACSQRACDAGVCSVTLADKDTPAASGQNPGDCSTIMCDGNGGIYLSADATDVPAAADECHVGSCDGGPPHQIAAPIGTVCSAGGIVCDGNGLCVECLQNSDCPMGACAGSTCVGASCGDGIKDVNETDTDCGGACGASCAVGQTCMTGADCITGNCESSACALLPVGVACVSDAVCASGSCASGVCCSTPCLGACNTCATGACEPVLAGTDPEGACAPSVCDGFGSCGACEPGIEIGECCTNCAKDPGPPSAVPGDTPWTPPCCVPQVCGPNGQPEPCF